EVVAVPGAGSLDGATLWRLADADPRVLAPESFAGAVAPDGDPAAPVVDLLQSYDELFVSYGESRGVVVADGVDLGDRRTVSMTSEVVGARRRRRQGGFMAPVDAPVGSMLREWRVRRRRSQLDLALGADVSARHISFLETGRARPSREMIDRLCDELDVPLRARNDVHLAAGYAPRHRETPLSTATLAAARRAVDLVLAGHEPFPAMAVDGRWDLVAANAAAGAFLDDVPDHLRAPRTNVLRLTLHPDGLAPRIANLAEWGG